MKTTTVLLKNLWFLFYKQIYWAIRAFGFNFAEIALAKNTNIRNNSCFTSVFEYLTQPSGFPNSDFSKLTKSTQLFLDYNKFYSNIEQK